MVGAAKRIKAWGRPVFIAFDAEFDSAHDKGRMADYPGNSYVDWVGFDPYNFYHCNSTPWHTFLQKVQPTYRWLAKQGLGHKPVLLSEYRTQYDKKHPARSKRWYDNIPAGLRQMPNVKALVRFDANGYFGSRKCDFYLNIGPGSVDAFARARHVVQRALRP